MTNPGGQKPRPPHSSSPIPPVVAGLYWCSCLTVFIIIWNNFSVKNKRLTFFYLFGQLLLEVTSDKNRDTIYGIYRTHKYFNLYHNERFMNPSNIILYKLEQFNVYTYNKHNNIIWHKKMPLNVKNSPIRVNLWENGFYVIWSY